MYDDDDYDYDDDVFAKSSFLPTLRVELLTVCAWYRINLSVNASTIPLSVSLCPHICEWIECQPADADAVGRLPISARQSIL